MARKEEEMKLEFVVCPTDELQQLAKEEGWLDWANQDEISLILISNRMTGTYTIRDMAVMIWINTCPKKRRWGGKSTLKEIESVLFARNCIYYCEVLDSWRKDHPYKPILVKEG